MENKNKSMFPITKSDGHGNVITIGGITAYEEFTVRILCSMLENPRSNVEDSDLINIAKLYAEKILLQS